MEATSGGPDDRHARRLHRRPRAAADRSTGSTANLTSGATRVLTATIQDAAGNTVASDNTTVVAFGKTLGSGSVTGTGTATASGGVATKTITGALAGSVTMEASAPVSRPARSAVQRRPRRRNQHRAHRLHPNLTSGAHTSDRDDQDAAGNPVTADNTTVIAFGKTAGTGTVTGTGNATAASGVATKTITGALAGPITLEATSTGLTTGTLGSSPSSTAPQPRSS